MSAKFHSVVSQNPKRLGFYRSTCQLQNRWYIQSSSKVKQGWSKKYRHSGADINVFIFGTLHRRNLATVTLYFDDDLNMLLMVVIAGTGRQLPEGTPFAYAAAWTRVPQQNGFHDAGSAPRSTTSAI
jgi:hypothetical protein